MATSTGPGPGPTRAPGGWVLRTRGPDCVHGVQHRPHVRCPQAAPLPLRVVQQYALVVPPVPRSVTAAPAAAAGPSAKPPVLAALLLGGAPPPPPPGDLPPLANLGEGGGRGAADELHGVVTRVCDLWAPHFATEPPALVLRRWAGGEHSFCPGAGTQRRRPRGASVRGTVAGTRPCIALGAPGSNGELLSGLTGHHISSSYGRKTPATTAHRGPHPLGRNRAGRV